MKDRKVEFEWNDFLEIWKLAFIRGYVYGYKDKYFGNYNPEFHAHPPVILKKIFESYVPEKEEEE